MTTATAEHEVAHGHDEIDSVATGPSYDDINTPVILMVGAISAIVTVCSIFFVQGLCYQWQNRYIRDRSLDSVNTPVRDVVEQQKSLLNGKQDGIKSIDDSMEAVIMKYSKQVAK